MLILENMNYVPALRAVRSAALAGLFALAVLACGDDSSADPVCGDDVCDASESATTCPADCGCGNGVLNPGEACDGSDLGGATCESEAGQGGVLACNSDCTFDVTGCDAAMCGNDVVEDGEVCDGTDLAGETCASLGFSGGDLSCTGDCGLDPSTCCNDFCNEEGTAVCNGDSLEACVMGANGCLTLDVTDCAANDDICDDSEAEPACVCVDRCPMEGMSHCDGAVAETCVLEADGCLAWTPVTDCAMSGETCAIGPEGQPMCTSPATAEDCSDPFELAPGDNVIAWAATEADYLTTEPSCNTIGDPAGPDLVLSYTAASDGIVTFAMEKPASARQMIVVSDAACGTVTPELECLSEYTPTTLGSTFAVVQGTTYYFYVRDTDSGSAPLSNPLLMTVNETACTAYSNDATHLSPSDGATIATTTTTLSVDLQHPVDPSTGTITVTGDLGTSLSFDLSTSPSEVSFSNEGRTMAIDPGVSFQPGETVTVSWSGLQDPFCSASIPAPTWSFSILTPSCSPGTGGMVGNTMTRISTGLGTFTEYYMATDTELDGYVYLGGTSDLYRVAKDGATFEDVAATTDISFSELGYDMAVVGGSIFTLDDTISTSSPFLYRLSSTGGQTWNPLGYGMYPTTPNDGVAGVFHDNGRLYMVTDEFSSGVDTEIWSVPVSAISLPTYAVLEGSVAGEEDCTGISGDDDYFYLTCANADRLVRVDRTTYDSELITDRIDLSLTNNAVHAHDFDDDGRADALYVKTDEENFHYVCDPGGTGPYWVDLFAEWGTGTINYGLAFDPVNNELWAYDDDTQELLLFQ